MIQYLCQVYSVQDPRTALYTVFTACSHPLSMGDGLVTIYGNWNHVKMIRFLIHVAISITSSALALLMCSWILEGFTFTWEGFLLAILVFTLAQAILAPFAFNIARKHANGLLGAIGLVSTLLALIVTSFFPGGLHISGISTWILASLVTWIVTSLGVWLIPLIFIKKKSSGS